MNFDSKCGRIEGIFRGLSIVRYSCFIPSVNICLPGEELSVAIRGEFSSALSGSFSQVDVKPVGMSMGVACILSL